VTAKGRTATVVPPRLIPSGSTIVLLQPENEDEMDTIATVVRRAPWNKAKLVGQKAPLKVEDVSAIRVRLVRTRDLALFDPGIDCKLRACDLVKLRVRDVCHGDRVDARAVVLQQKTQRPAQLEITVSTREAIEAWIRLGATARGRLPLPSRLHASPHLGTRQYARTVDGWVKEIGLDSAGYRPHSFRRTKATLIYWRTRKLRPVQLLLGRTKLESTVRYFGIEDDDAIEIAEPNRSLMLVPWPSRERRTTGRLPVVSSRSA